MIQREEDKNKVEIVDAYAVEDTFPHNDWLYKRWVDKDKQKY